MLRGVSAISLDTMSSFRIEKHLNGLESFDGVFFQLYLGIYGILKQMGWPRCEKVCFKVSSSFSRKQPTRDRRRHKQLFICEKPSVVLWYVLIDIRSFLTAEVRLS